jgi:hypothetical protein
MAIAKRRLRWLINLWPPFLGAGTAARLGRRVTGVVTAIRRRFAPGEIREYLNHLEQTKFLAPPEPEIDDGDEEEEEPWSANPVRAAEELLRFSRIRQLLQP